MGEERKQRQEQEHEREREHRARPRARRKFTEEFKRDAGELVRSTGRPIAEVARELDLYDSTLGNWVLCRHRHKAQSRSAWSEIPRSRATCGTLLPELRASATALTAELLRIRPVIPGHP